MNTVFPNTGTITSNNHFFTKETTVSDKKQEKIDAIPADFDISEPFAPNESLLLNDEEDLNEQIMSAATYDQGLSALFVQTSIDKLC